MNLLGSLVHVLKLQAHVLLFIARWVSFTWHSPPVLVGMKYFLLSLYIYPFSLYIHSHEMCIYFFEWVMIPIIATQNGLIFAMGLSSDANDDGGGRN